MSDRAGDVGTIGVPALARIRNLWIDLEPLVRDTRYDDPVKTTELHVELEDGLRAAADARFDIQWSDTGNYSFHYTDDEGVNWRFDRHPNAHSPEKHYHPPAGGVDRPRRTILHPGRGSVTRHSRSDRDFARRSRKQRDESPQRRVEFAVTIPQPR